MDTFRGAHAGARSSWRLSQLYSDAKQQYRQAASAPTSDDHPEVQSLNRKFRLQKDRLIAWGFDWNDADSANSGEASIDESVERAGLTEVVSSILENIIQMIDDVEKMRALSASNTPGSAYPLEKTIQWDSSNRARYTDLTRDITSSIDLLCELSKNKPSQPSRAQMPDEKRQLAAKYSLQGYDDASRAAEPAPSVPTAAQEISLWRIVMPEEAPPPYEVVGLPCPDRIVGQLRTSQAPNASTLPILIEFAAFDKIYRENSVPLPMNRVESLSKLMQSKHASRPNSLLNFLGYFEDETRPRVGLVYEIPSWATGVTGGHVKPTTLYELLISASKSQPSAAVPSIVPALEERYRLASELASGFSALTEGSFLHRNINSNSVSFLPSGKLTAGADPYYALRKPVLGGFDLFSEYDIDVTPENLDQNTYRHPDDPRINKGTMGSENSNNLRFDIYSVGLVLLEIGLWVPLADIFKEKYSLNDFSLRLQKIWVPRLASKCGTAYMSAVRACLAAGNDENVTSGVLRMTYERVTTKLAKCCVLDDDSDIAEDMPNEPLASPQPQFSPSPAPRRQSDTTTMRASSIPRKPLPSLSSQLDVKTIPEDQVQPTTPTVPQGAYPQVPMEPDFEITSFSNHAREKVPVRYTFPFLPLSRDIRDSGRTVAKRLCKIGEKVLDPRETSSIAIHGFGESETNCKPTFCIMCTNTRKFYKAVKKNLDFDKSTFDLIIFKGDVVRSKSTRKSSKVYRSDARSGARLMDEIEAKNPAHHARPLCGASIGAWKDFEHLPPVSFGGVIMIDGQQFGMTVHHMLESSDDEGEDEEQLHELRKSRAPGKRGKASRSSAKRQDSEFTLQSFVEVEDMSDAFSEELSEDDSDVESITFSDIDEDEMEEDKMDVTIEPDAGDTEGIAVGKGKNITITQPALADVDEDFFPVEEDMDDDHLDSHTFGELYASSGLRRITDKGSRQEIDWALFKLDSSRLQTCNVIAGGRRHYQGRSNGSSEPKPKLRAPVCRKPFQPHEDHYPSFVLPSDDMGSQPVHCFGRTSGLSTGRIGTTMEFVKMVGRSTWSESWVVHALPGSNVSMSDELPGPNLGVPGDSGAWIIDNQQGKVCGHVLAWSEKKKTAYIAPMDVMLSDIKQTLGARAVTLLGEETSATVGETGTSDARASAPTGGVLNLPARPQLHSGSGSNVFPATPTPAVHQVMTRGRDRGPVALPSPPESPAPERRRMDNDWSATPEAMQVEA